VKHPKTHINQINKDKHKEQILKAAREKQVPGQDIPSKFSSNTGAQP